MINCFEMHAVDEIIVEKFAVNLLYEIKTILQHNINT